MSRRRRAPNCRPATIRFRLAWRRNSPETPELLAGFRVVGVEESPDARFASADAHDDLAVDCQRRRRDRVAGRIVADGRDPPLDARSRVERDEVAVQGADIESVVENRDAAIDPRKTEV